VSVVPTILEFLLEANEDISKYSIGHFKWIICGAGPLLVETALNFQERFNIPIMHGYGLSETTCYSCFLPTDLRIDELTYWLSHHKFPSIGVPIKHNDMAIIDEKGNELKELEKGEIVVKGRTVIKGYFKRPDANKDAFKFGWFRTGDEGFYKLDKQKRKFFFITGRIKELIIRGGINISPLEVDDVGIEITEKDVLEYCKRKLDFKKQPKVVIIGIDIPYTSTGKPKRLELKEKLKDELHKYRDIQFREK
jgi:long-chain acyl-CoA synthetase